MKRRTFVQHVPALAVGLSAVGPAFAAGFNPYYDSKIIPWNRALLNAIAATRMQATMAARACAMVYEAMYNANAAFSNVSAFTLPGMVRAQSYWRGEQMAAMAFSQAAYLVLVDLFPTQKAVFDGVLATAINNPFNGQPNWLASLQIGTTAGNALLNARHNDGSNQLGDLAPGAYADYTGYVSVNTPDQLVDPTRWQPLRYIDATGATVVQKYLTPQWGRVRPFALASGSALRPVMDHAAPTQAEMQQLIDFSAALNDTTKAQVDYWAGNPGTISPPGQWMLLAEQVSAYDKLQQDQAINMYFALAQGLLDASIAAWDVKRVYDSVRPITAIPYYFRNQTITAWGGPNQGTKTMLGQDWFPYQRRSLPSPAFPEIVSGHSTFSFSAATILKGLRGSDIVPLTGQMPAGGIGFETNVPKTTIVFKWASLSETAASAGLSRRLGGIHFEQGDLKARALGASVGAVVLAKCQRLFAGRTG